MKKFIIALGLAFLAGCGGGGDGGSSPALTFSPASVTANYAAGTSANVTIQATVNDPGDFGNGTVWVYVVDPNLVLSGPVDITQIDATTYSVVVHTSAMLTPGNYQGAFQVQLCRDPACAAQYPGSPMTLPYNLTVSP